MLKIFVEKFLKPRSQGDENKFYSYYSTISFSKLLKYADFHY